MTGYRSRRARQWGTAQTSRGQARNLADSQAWQAWQRGDIAPWRITLALDARGLYGPGVDRACGVEEPAVDEWEAGRLYPTFEQLLALARLTQYPATAFVYRHGEQPLHWADTTIRFHLPWSAQLELFEFDRGDPVLRFDPAAVEATLGRPT